MHEWQDFVSDLLACAEERVRDGFCAVFPRFTAGVFAWLYVDYDILQGKAVDLDTELGGQVEEVAFVRRLGYGGLSLDGEEGRRLEGFERPLRRSDVCFPRHSARS